MNASSLLGEIPFCEQKFLPYFQEPLSVLSNIGFLFAAYYLLKEKPSSFAEKSLVILTALVGLGSASYHAYRHPVTHFLDVIPIYLVLMVSLYLLAKKLTRNTKTSTIFLALFAGLQAGLALLVPQNFLKTFLNGSLRYVLALLVLLALFLYANHKKLKNSRLLLYGLISFAIAIFFRSIDILVCPVFPSGTHFLWHIFVSATAYYSALFILHFERSKKQGSAKQVLKL